MNMNTNFGDVGENEYSISQITQVYNPIVNNLDGIAREIYNRSILGPDDTNVYNRDNNNIKAKELVEYIMPYAENLTGEQIKVICELFVEASFIYTEKNFCSFPKRYTSKFIR